MFGAIRRLAGIVIASGGTFKWNAPNGAMVLANGGGQIVNNGGTFLKSSTGTGVCALPYYSSADSALLNVQNGTMELSKSGANGASWSVVQDQGKILLSRGTTLQVDYGLEMNGGQLTTTGNADITSGDLFIQGGTVSIGGDNGVAGLYCTGQVTMNGGTYLVTVDATRQQSDLWGASKGFILGGTATLTANTVNVPAGGVPANLTFKILNVPAGQSIQGDFATKNPAYAPGKAYNTTESAGGLNYLLGT